MLSSIFVGCIARKSPYPITNKTKSNQPINQPIKQSKPKQTTNQPTQNNKLASNKLRMFAYQLILFNTLITSMITLNKSIIFHRLYNRQSEGTFVISHGPEYERQYKVIITIRYVGYLCTFWYTITLQKIGIFPFILL